MKLKNLGIIGASLIFLCSLFVTDDAFSRGGGGRSFSSSRSSSWNSSKSYSPSRSSSWSSSKSNRGSYTSISKPSSSTNTKSFSASKSTRSENATKSSFDRNLYKNAKKNGKAFSSKTEAIKDFKAKNATKYTTTFKTEPTKRPSYISSSVTVSGVSRPVIFHNGGYGFYVGSVWTPYNPWIYNAAYMDNVMYGSGYYVGNPTNPIWIIVTVLGLIVFISGIIFIVKEI